MDVQGKQDFISSLCDSIRDEGMEKAEHMPDNWDGMELRQWLRDKFEREVYRMARSRKIRYNREVASNPKL